MAERLDQDERERRQSAETPDIDAIRAVAGGGAQQPSSTPDLDAIRAVVSQPQQQSTPDLDAIRAVASQPAQQQTPDIDAIRAVAGPDPQREAHALATRAVTQRPDAAMLGPVGRRAEIDRMRHLFGQRPQAEQELAGAARATAADTSGFGNFRNQAVASALSTTGSLGSLVTGDDTPRQLFEAQRAASGEQLGTVGRVAADLTGAIGDPVFFGAFGAGRAALGATKIGQAAAKATGFRGIAAREGLDAVAGVPADALTGGIQGGADPQRTAVGEATRQAATGAVLGPIVGGAARTVGAGVRRVVRGEGKGAQRLAELSAEGQRRAGVERIRAREAAEQARQEIPDAAQAQGAEVQVQEAGGLPAQRGQPAERFTAGEAEARTALREGEGPTPQASKAVERSPSRLHEAIENATETAIARAESAGRLAKRTFMRGRNFVGHYNQRLARDLDEVDIRAGQRAAQSREDLRELLRRQPREQRELAMKVLNGRAKADDPAVQELADRVRDILDRDLRAGQELGVQRRLADGTLIPLGGSGKAFPQVPNRRGRTFLRELTRKGLNSPRVMRWAEQMVAEGKADSLEDALSQMRTFQNRLRGTNRYFERTRVELPEDMVEWDPDRVLPDLLERNSVFLEAARQWGYDPNGGMLRAQIEIEDIRQRHGSEVAEPIEKFFEYEFGAQVANRDTQAIAGFISSFETASKLGVSVLSPLRNLMQPSSNFSSRFGYIPILRANLALPPFLKRWIPAAKQIDRAVMRSGAVRGRTTLTELETPEGGITDKLLTLFTASEKRNQHVTALAARYAIESDLKRLMRLQKASRVERMLRAAMSLGGGSEGATRRRLTERAQLGPERIEALSDKIASGKRLEIEDVADAMFLINRDTNFPLTLSSRRLWWTQQPWMRLAAKFKTFSVEQTALIYRDVLKESRRGNLAPLARFVAATIVAGEIYNSARDLLVGDDQAISTGLRRGTITDAEALALRILNNMVDGGGVGIIADMVYGVTDWSLGPAFGTVQNALDKGAHIAAKPTPDQAGRAILDFIGREFAVSGQVRGVTSRAEQLLGGENRVVDYRRARRFIREFGERTDEPGLPARVREAVTKSLRGGATFEITGRTLSLRHAAEQIAAGDIEDAAEYFAGIIRDADPADRKRVVDGIRQSIRSRAPFGVIPSRDLPLMLRSVPEDRRREFIELQKRWLSDANRALQIALGKARN